MKPKFTDAHRFQRRPYDPSHATDIRKRFDAVKDAIKKEQARSAELIAAAEKQSQEIAEEAARKVKPLIKARTA